MQTPRIPTEHDNGSRTLSTDQYAAAIAAVRSQLGLDDSADIGALLAAATRQQTRALSAVEREATSWQTFITRADESAAEYSTFLTDEARNVPAADPFSGKPIAGTASPLAVFDYRSPWLATVDLANGSQIVVSIDRINGRTNIRQGIGKSDTGFEKLSAAQFYMALRRGMFHEYPGASAAIKALHVAIMATATSEVYKAFVAAAVKLRADVQNALA